MKRVDSAPFSYIAAICVIFCLLLLQCVSSNDDEDEHEHDDFAEMSAEEWNHICEDPPPPLNSKSPMSCGKNKKGRYVCKAECKEGYHFPNRRTKARHFCDLQTGRWSPEYDFPDCKPKCVPPCENGGECSEGNHCICTPEYRGDRCQYGLDLCEPEKGLHVSADWSCNHTIEQTACILNCPQGTRYDSPPADIYHCSLDGSWTPSFAPKCIPINVIEPPSANGMYSVAAGQAVSSVPNSGVCAVWGNSHLRTFDGGIYSFQGACTYLLSKDCEQNTFAIHIQNSEPCETISSCSTLLAIYTGSEQYILTGGGAEGIPTVQTAGEVYTIPASVNGVLFEVLSGYVTISSSLGFRLKWNRKNTVLLKVSNQLQNRTCGLCGKFDGSVLNDLETSDGSLTDSVEGFVNSWTMEDLGEKCVKKAVVKDSCSENKEKVSEAEALCNVIFDKKFEPCHEIVDPKVYYEVCKMDHCACPFGSCYCGTLAEYFRECTRLGGKLEGGWRSSELCPLNCPEGMVYEDCGTSCPRTCKGTYYDCEDHHCVDGCHCPSGMVLHEGRCVEKRDCPCMHNGKEYPNGARILDDCNACECISGKWDCTKEKCEARCTSAGDPHYTTFDGLNYEFFGSCSYYLVYNKNFTIVQETGPCPVSSGSEPATEGMFCTNRIEVKYMDETLVLEPGIKVMFNDKDANLPISSSTITASMATDLFLKVNLINGVNVLWDGQNRIYIDAPPSLYEQTAGLCGTFNKNQNDDFLTPSNDIEADVSSFASKWKAATGCDRRSRRSSRRSSPCEAQPQKLKDASEFCSIIKSDIFEACHAELDPYSYYKNCLNDLCLCRNQDLTTCVCPILADYSLSCTQKGVIVNWVDEIIPCKPDCSGGQIYQECGNPCTSSCAAIASSNMCTQQCVQGCTCADGMALNGEGFCVAVDQCPCIYESKEYLPASVTVQGSNVCTCQGAKWQCRLGTLPELASLNSDLMIDDGAVNCLPENNEEYTKCREECPRTCQNMHLPVECNTEECKPGCRCKEGFIFDSDLKKCVKESECGCVHGRHRYKEGESIRQSCNLCTCVEGLWICTDKECSGVCSVWGESHFKTFDGKIFDFQGDCEYVLSKGKMEDVSYSLSIRNVPCGTSDVTCSKSFTLDLGPRISRADIEETTDETETLTLIRDEPLPKLSYSSRFVVVEAGLFVMVYTDIGLTLQWDRGTRIYVTVEPKWRKRVKGLCGNFNDDQGDDFLTPSGGIPEASSSIFAQSWKVQEFCPHTKSVEDMCEAHPHRKSWAQQKCGILKAEAFTACHSEVAMEPYYERCIFDACACDIGGDCECLCTAIAAYAQECNMRGVSVKWRSQELCPIQCEECSTYDSCVPSCPEKTCENEIVYAKIEQACSSNFCVEGCHPKPCPAGQIYNNGREYKCIPEIECVVPCMELNGKIYNEGDRITDVQVVDSCQECHCLKGNIKCTGQPCVNNEPLKACARTGWTPWMNTPVMVGGDFEVLTDPRLRVTLENYCGITNVTDIDCRTVDTKQPYKETGQIVSCRLPYGLSCRDDKQKDSVCHDYEIRLYCDCGPVPTTEVIIPTVTIPQTLSPVCEETGWTAWMSGHLPSEEGEFETLDRLRVNHFFCADDMLENIECRSRKNWEYVTEDENIVCNKKLGLVCKGPQCEDYEVRVYCNCGVETTPAPVPPCVTGWTEYFNTDNPATSDTGDDESLDRIREQHNFCVGGTIEDIECKAVVGDQLVDYKEFDTFGLKCSKNVGFECNKYIRTEKCPDFTVRFFCACEPLPVTTTQLITSTLAETTTSIPITPVPVECGWTPWLNIDSPESELGDIEDLAKLQIIYKTCGGKDLVDIECRMSRTLHKYSESLQNNLICNTEEGFKCLHEDQIGPCYDYEVRLLCMYPWCYPPTTSVPTTVTENPCPEGKVYDPCAFPCDQLCSSLREKVSEECMNSVDGCLPGCRPAEGCESPNLWRDYYTCVPKENCICAMPDENGTIINIAPNEVIEMNCEKCQCLEDSMFCNKVPGCGIFVTAPPRAIRPEDIVQQDCWTEWINIDNPSVGGGDLETPSKFRKIFEFCHDPVKIECRTALSKEKASEVGQKVICDVEKGLICWNKDNKPEDCLDYEIRFFCPCPNQVPLTTTPIPTLEPGPCLYGWTEWYNTHIPDGRGEYETVQSSRISNSFCSNDMISAIECRQVGKASGKLQNGVTCELDIGLRCNPELLYEEEVCSDYEVRFFCDCPTMAPFTETLPTPKVTTEQPVIYNACSGWSEWINEHHPSTEGGGGTKKQSVKGGGAARSDFEKALLLKLQRDYDFCHDGEITDIECREASTDLNYKKTGDKKLVCSRTSGFRCRAKDQPGRLCKDYKIRYFCTCHEQPTTTPVIIKTTVPPITVPPCNDEFYLMVDGPSPLPDASLKASTSRDSSSGPQNARLTSKYNDKSAGAWIAGKFNEFQFIEIDLENIQPVYGVVTKGQQAHTAWVKSFKILYSRDGVAYTYIKDPTAPNVEKVFTGNYDSDSEVQHIFEHPIEARFVRIQPITYHKSIAMRVDLLGCASGMPTPRPTAPGPICTDEMGMFSGEIENSQITTSSDRNEHSGAEYARLNTVQTEEHTGGWVAGELNDKQYIQVDFIEPRNLTGVKTQGRDMVPQWVTAFYISYSQDGVKWNILKDEFGTVIFPGNYDSTTVAITYFDRPIRARFLRIHPKFWENWISMRFEVIGCYEPLNLVKPGIHTTIPPYYTPECYDPMGFENHEFPDTLISVSSSLDANSGPSRIRLNTHREGDLTGGWIPAAGDYMPKVYIDFYEERNLTGIETQGLEDADSWVVSYKVSYSLDNITWDFITEIDTNGVVFNGNQDRNSIVTRLFSRMITARFLQIIILDYHNGPALRMEILGCFIPYPVYTPPPVLHTTTEMCVNSGPWISLSDPAYSSFDGDVEPIDDVISASKVCRNPFEIECRTQITKKDPFQAGQSVICDLTHGLICKNDDQTSSLCYNYEVRIKCWTCELETTPPPLEMCPEIPDTFRSSCPESCPFGFACDGANCVPSTDCPCFQNGKRFDPSNMAITSECHSCECILGGHSRCEPIKCPDCLPGQKSEIDPSCHCGCVGCAIGTVLCPTSGECIGEEKWCDGVLDCPDDETGCPTTTTLAPSTTVTTTTELPIICSTDYLPDTDSCEMVANMFETFDGLTYQYDICDHVLMKEAASGVYSVIVHKTCTSDAGYFCYRYLVIDVDGIIIKLGPGLEDVTLKDIRIPTSNLWLVSKRFQDFELKMYGNHLVFRSFKYHFDVTWDSLADARITVSRCLVHNIAGLCGLYNKQVIDDRTMPNGNLASGNQEFGDSWSVGSLEDCRQPQCPAETMKTAMEICNQLRQEPFNSSCNEYIKMENRVEACVVYMCECMRQPPLDARLTPSKDVMYDFFGADGCKCEAFESFAEACEEAKQGPVQDWRMRHDCTPECPVGMEWQDCGPGCELTCDNYHQQAEVCSTGCVPGCYCPSGLVRHHNRCVKPKMCQDCVCRGHGDPNYISFDGQYYAFQGTCTYILAQYQSPDEPKLNFRILSTNVECPEEPQTACAQGLTIYWNGHVIEKFKNKPIYLDEKMLSPEDSPLDYEGISITFVPNKSTIIHIQDINLVVRYFDQMYGFNIELPAFYYYNKTEGLCGVCNFIKSDDLYHRDGYVTEDVDDFAFSWLEGHERRENCEFPRELVPEPPPGICNFTANSCDIFLDPELYSKSCQNDVSYSRNPEASVCRAKFQYAQQCCERGVSLVEWLQLSGCESTCPQGMVYECTSACQKTCDNYKSFQEDDCSLTPLYTCVCPEGEVMKLGKCVKTLQCEVCDADGHVVGETWKEGPCESCECMPDLTKKCTVTECPEAPICGVREMLQRFNRSADACCEAYQCMPLAEENCPEVPLDCPPGQANVKDYKGPCPVYRCECIPEMCPPPVLPLVDDGENVTLLTIDCCQEYRVTCDLDSCAPPPDCGPGFKLSTYLGSCCTKYTCVPKKNVCVYQHKYDILNGAQVDLPLEEYYEKEYEPGSSWQDGLCRQCSCIDMGGQFAYSCREEKCPDPSDFPDAEKYFREKIHIPGACCPKYRRTACIVQGIKYQIDEEWPSPEGDPCKSYRCILDPHGEAIILEKTSICQIACPQNAKYVEAEPGSGKCCGTCKLFACEENGILYNNGDTWISTTKPCFTAECQVSENGTRISYQGESCPIMPDNCPPENVRTDPKGCCTYCKSVRDSCSPVEVPLYETRGFFGYVDERRGLCSNEQVLHGLTKCGGQCPSASHYSDLIGDFQSVCNCCLPKESQNRNISLDCADGSKVEKVYEQPISCHCISCSGGNRDLESLNRVELSRK